MATPTEGGAAPAGKLAWVWLGLAVAALLSSWNPFAAPAGLVLGLASGALGLLAARRRRGNRLAATAALALGAVAAVVSGLVLALTAGAVTSELPGEPVIRPRSAAEASTLLDAARSASDPARQRARRELDAAGGAGRETAKDDEPLEPVAPPPDPEEEDEPE